MRRGEFRFVDLDHVRGSEADKRRPEVIVSNDGANATAARLGRGALTVVPVTSSVSPLYPFQVLLPAAVTGLKRDSTTVGNTVALAVRALRQDHIGHPLRATVTSEESVWLDADLG